MKKFYKKLTVLVLIIVIVISALVIFNSLQKQEEIDEQKAPTPTEQNIVYLDKEGNLFSANATNIGETSEAIEKITGEDEFIKTIDFINNVVYFLNCKEKYECVLKEFNVVDNDLVSEIKIPNLTLSPSDLVSLSPDKENLFILTATELIQFKLINNEKIILKDWKVLGLGVGGIFCNNLKVSPNSRFVVFCRSSAETNEIQGKLFIYDQEKKTQTNLNEKFCMQDENIIYPLFAQDSNLVFQCENSQTINKIDLESFTIINQKQVVDLKEYSLLSNNRKYAEFNNSSEESKYLFLESLVFSDLPPEGYPQITDWSRISSFTISK